MTSPNAAHSRQRTGNQAARRRVTIRTMSNRASEARGTARLSLLTAPLMNKNIGRKALIAAAPRATTGRPGAVSAANR